LFTTVAKAMQQSEELAFSFGSVPVMTSYNSTGIGDGVFFCGLFTGYIARTSAGSQCSYMDSSSLKLAVSGESSAEELVDGQWEPVGSAGGPGP
jgi:hypothetical protein